MPVHESRPEFLSLNSEILLGNFDLGGPHVVSGIAHDIGILIDQEYVVRLNAGIYVGVEPFHSAPGENTP